ncbi:hypothetical protein SAMN04515671_4223 [Nakamurella panacisegetis]|uniref:Pyridoxamine 5'-phosphate oxidase N-terminal domain-containing protein n=1 Tax=Nakamurella panacisegetis TaxID=1090615 RepID=A0A1H0SPJ4_9ACTN|nr:PPOX class F420-dependent oxidoreductase [Nakamurella panacisegetis]SDP43603.1 hypothetical protein SAMN04515671_4223 [Nakamurella panacisegetis]
MTTPLDLLARAPYVRLTTFRRDGTPVQTPVWAARVGDELVVWTNPLAGKVKRIRRNRQVLIGPCTMRGEPRGRAVEATARILSADELGAVRPALVGKYGWAARLAFAPYTFDALLRRPPRPFAALAVTLAE